MITPNTAITTQNTTSSHTEGIAFSQSTQPQNHSNVRSYGFSQQEVFSHFGPPLSCESIAKANQGPATNVGERTHHFEHFSFTASDRVFKPSKTSAVLHKMLFNQDLTDKTLVIMGTGCGVEPVVAAHRGASAVFAFDVHQPSVTCARSNFLAHYPNSQINLESKTLTADNPAQTKVSLTQSNLFNAAPPGIKADIMCFDPPAVKVQFSNDPDQIRSSCTGASILHDFFAQIQSGQFLADNGTAYVMISNTADQHSIIEDAYEQGFVVKELTTHTWEKPYDHVKALQLGFGYGPSSIAAETSVSEISATENEVADILSFERV